MAGGQERRDVVAKAVAVIPRDPADLLRQISPPLFIVKAALFHRPAEEQRAFFHDTAAAFYRI